MATRRDAAALMLGSMVTLGAIGCGSVPDRPLGETQDGVTSSPTYDVDTLIADLHVYEEQSRAEGKKPDRNAFLARLPAQFKRRYTVLRASNAEDSVDDTDPTDARVLAFGDTAELTVAWTRDATGFQTAQHRGSRLELRRIEFLEDRVSISEANPSGCGSSDCHGEDEKDPRYRWDAYPRWPKAFAADNDYVTPGADEARVRKFFESAETQPAFSMLERNFGVEKTIGTFRIGTPGQRETAPSGTKATASSTGYADGTSALSYQFRPNTFLTLAYARMHAEQVFARLTESEGYSLYEYPLLFVLSRCAWPAADVAGRDAVNASLAATAKPRTAPRIDVGPDPKKWMPWFEFLGLSADRLMLSDDLPLATVDGLRQDHLYNEGFTSLVYFIGARVSENIKSRRPDWIYLRGQNLAVESKLFGNLAYEDKPALLSQVKALDGLGAFLNVDPRPYLVQAREAGHDDRAKQSCDAIRGVVRQQFRLD